MKRRTIILVIVLMAISLVGIVVMQLLWMKNAIEVKETEFDRSVNDALHLAVRKMDKHGTFMFFMDKIQEKRPANYFGTTDSVFLPNMQWQNPEAAVVPDSFPPKSALQSQITFGIELRSGKLRPRHQFFVEFHQFDNQDSEIQMSAETLSVLPRNSWLEAESLFSDSLIFNDKSDTSLAALVEKENELLRRSEHINRVIREMAVEIEISNLPVHQRFALDELQYLLADELKNKGINTDFEYAVINSQNDSVLDFHSQGFDSESMESKYRVSLSQGSVFASPLHLVVDFPNKQTHLFRSISLLLTGSLFFSLIILLTFFITIFVILRQKKLSEIKSDFINNMTHEFKTPIATISLAVDSISMPKILKTKEKVLYFTGVIKDEAKRMNTLVESVLQMALIDKKDFQLKPQYLDVHQLIEKAIDSIRIQVDKKRGSLQVNFCAEKHDLKVDKIHFTNLIYNLLDNAIKYSGEKPPEIAVETHNDGNHLKISVSDKGVGMNRETQNKVFEKFYRQSSGNIHNVKGYGLGLSYVRAIVAEHKGRIEVSSEVGKGSRFDIFMPLEIY